MRTRLSLVQGISPAMSVQLRDQIQLLERVVENRTSDPVESESLTGSLRDYRDPRGADLFSRVDDFYRWQDGRRARGYWPYAKSTETAPRPTCSAKDDRGHPFAGVNFSSQDYLGLSSHPSIIDAAKAAIDAYGVHSAGSQCFLGNTRYSLALQHTIADFLGLEHVVLYPTGWAAGYGAIKGLVRADDHVVIDVLGHACLQDGAAAATRNIHFYSHLNVQAVRRQLRRIRAHDTTNGILVVTEALFSMDSDTPDIGALQDLCREYNARLLVDVAHDLGNIGADGTGHIGLQQMLGQVDIVMGAFSKTFATNGGFVACGSPAVAEYLKYFGSSGTFSNALSPSQAAIALRAFEIVRSNEGRALRAALMRNVLSLRGELEHAGMEVYGDPSAIVSVKMGDEAFARIVSKHLPHLGVVANLVEFPAVPRGNARFRLQVMATHTPANIRELVKRFLVTVETARIVHDCRRERMTAEQPIACAVGA
ncbi:MAG: aminotransferase class I/II-fold pyridoxal phosphate-dependent enzyme [Stellaceae bacterium]